MGPSPVETYPLIEFEDCCAAKTFEGLVVWIEDPSKVMKMPISKAAGASSVSRMIMFVTSVRSNV